MSPLSYLMLGLATSVHCVAMCGGLVLTYAAGEDPGGSVLQRLRPHVAYQGAKIVSYMLVAMVLGVVASVAGVALDITGLRNWIMVFAGTYMVLLGLAMTGAFPALRYLTPRPPKLLVRALVRGRRKAVEESASTGGSAGTAVAFGFLTGLMPCAPLMAAQAGALSAGSPIEGAILMLAFGIGTAPLMLFFGLAASALGAAFRRRMLAVAAIAVILFGLVILNRGALLVGSPLTFQSVVAAVSGDASTGDKDAYEGDVVEVPLVIRNTRFEPATVEIPADTAVRLVVDRQEGNTCSDQIAVPQLGVLQDVEAFAVTIVDLPAAAAGTYTLTCGMGMMSGQLVVGGAAAADRTPLVLGLGLLVVVGGALALMWRRPGETRSVRAGGPRERSVLGLSVGETALIAVVLALAATAGLLAGSVFR